MAVVVVRLVLPGAEASNLAVNKRPASLKLRPSSQEMAKIQSGLCLYHFPHGEMANSCTPLCSWGN